MPYDPALVQPMRDELTAIGIRELTTAAEVEEFMTDLSDSTLLVINSVCGCAAGMARPALQLALEHPTHPQRVASVFAGQDLEATARAREYLGEIPPSSPSFVLFKDGKLVHDVPRHRIEGHSAQEVTDELVQAFDQHCAAGE